MKIRDLELLACDAGWRNYHFVKVTTEDGIVGWSEYDEGFGAPGVGAVIDRLIVRRDRIVLHVHEHQAKGQFLEIARDLLIGARYLAIGTGDIELYIFAVPVPGGRQGQLARIIALSRQLRYK